MLKKIALLMLLMVFVIQFTGCREKEEVTDINELLDDHPAFNFGEFETFDSDDDGFSDGVEVAAGTDPLDQYDFPSTPTPEREDILLDLLILIGCIAIAVALVVHGFLRRSRPATAPSPKVLTKKHEMVS